MLSAFAVALAVILADALPAVDHLVPRPLLPLPAPALPVVPRLHPGRPDDGLLGKGKFEMTVKLPPEVLSLIQHVDDDRDGIAGYVRWALWLATVGVVLAGLATACYVVGGWRKGRDDPWR